MSLEQVKEIIRKPWANAEDHETAIRTRPKASAAKSKMGACLPTRIPVRITIRDSSGAAEIHLAMAILLNQRGARFETYETLSPENPLELHQMLWIEVISTQKAAGGKVIWADNRPNQDGNFEFAVELSDTGALFNVFFLKKDLDQPDAPKITSVTPAETYPIAEPVATPSPLPKPAELSRNPKPTTATSIENSASEVPMTDRLAELFKEVIHTAVRKEEDAVSIRIVKEVKEEVGQVQEAALEDLRKKVTHEVSVLENQLLQQCRSRTEQVVSTITQTALHALSDEMDEMAVRTEQRIQGIFSSLVKQLEDRSAQVIAETTSRLQAQVENSSTEVHGDLVDKVLSDISEKQKIMMDQVQQQIGVTTEQNLVQLRNGLMRALQELTESHQNGKLVSENSPKGIGRF